MEDLGVDQREVMPVRQRKLDDVAGSYTYFADGDVLLAKITPCFQNGKLGIARNLVNGVGFGSSEYIVLRPRPGLLSEYLFYFLARADFRSIGVSRMGGSVGQQRVPPAYVLEQQLRLPPLPEQRRIVAILDEAFAAIATAKANTENNLANARAVFDTHLQTVFAQQGEGWVNRPLIEVCTIVNGRAYKKDELLNEGKYPVLRVGNFFTNNNWYHSNLELEPDKYCDYGDLLYAWSASFGPRIWEGGKVIYHYHIWKVILNAARVEKRFLFHLLAWDVKEIKRAHGTGTTMMHVSKGLMEKRVVPVPPLVTQTLE